MWSAKDIAQQCDERISKAQKLLERLDEDTFQVWVELEELLLEADLHLPSLVSDDDSVREASQEAVKRLATFAKSMYTEETKAKLETIVAKDDEEAYYLSSVVGSFPNSVDFSTKFDLNNNANKVRSKIFFADQLIGLEFGGDPVMVDSDQAPQVLNFCQVEETRRAMASLQDCVPENLDLIPLLHLSPVDQPEASAMYQVLLPKLREKAKRDLEILGVTRLNHWDLWFLRRKWLRSTPLLDTDLLLSKTIEFMSGEFELKFVPSDQAVWHSTVKCFQVYEAGKLLGNLFFDLYDRDHKVNNPCTIMQKQNLTDRPGSVTIICNFGKTSSTSQCKDLLHEFGHALHCLYGRTKFARFSGVRVDRLYLELPAKYCERYLWSVMRMVVSEQELDNLKYNEKVTKHLELLMESALGQIDLELQGSDPQAIADKRWAEITGVNRDSGWLSGWWHLYNGYHGFYWTYQWNTIIAADLFGRVDLRNLLVHGGSRPFQVEFDLERGISLL